MCANSAIRNGKRLMTTFEQALKICCCSSFFLNSCLDRTGSGSALPEASELVHVAVAESA